jgi:hypothetical protein
MKLNEIRKLVSKLNNDDRIVGVWKMKKPQIIDQLDKLKYQLDEENKRLVPKVAMKRKKIIKL